MFPPVTPQLRDLAEWLGLLAGVLTTLGLRRWLLRQLRRLGDYLRRAVSRFLHREIYEGLAEQRAQTQQMRQLVEESGAMLRVHNNTMQALTGRIYEELQGVKATQEQLRKEWTTNGGGSGLDLLYLLAARQRTQDQDAPEPMWESDGEGRCRWVNRAYLLATGRELDEVLGHGWANALHPADRERVRESYLAAVEEDRDWEEEYRLFNHLTGASVPVRARDYRLRSPSGATIGRRGRAELLAS